VLAGMNWSPAGGELVSNSRMSAADADVAKLIKERMAAQQATDRKIRFFKIAIRPSR
jgi:hypothetical protein